MSVSRITPTEAAERINTDSGWVYVDVRSVMEFEKGHIPGAINIPLLNYDSELGGLKPNQQFLEVTQQRFDKETPIIIGCATGGRSFRAATELVARGFTQIVDMKGGFSGKRDALGGYEFPGWVQHDLPVSTHAHDCEHYKDVLEKTGG